MDILFFFLNSNFNLYYDSFVVGISTLSDNLYKIDLNYGFENSLNIVVGNKKKKV